MWHDLIGKSKKAKLAQRHEKLVCSREHQKLIKKTQLKQEQF